MKKIFETVKHNPLFEGIAFSDFTKMLDCLSATTTTFQPGAVILLAGDTVDFVGLIVAGSVQIIQEDLDGRVAMLAELGVAETFGEVFACADIAQSPVTVQAAEETEVLRLNYRRAITSCTTACPFHARLIRNMLKLLARKSLALNQKIGILSKRTTREKLLHFFDAQRGAAKKFTIPYDREELAQYICVDRSAMSNELCKMRNEGLIRFQKNTFELC